MTSSPLGSWTAGGLKVSLDRRWPSGLGLASSAGSAQLALRPVVQGRSLIYCVQRRQPVRSRLGFKAQIPPTAHLAFSVPHRNRLPSRSSTKVQVSPAAALRDAGARPERLAPAGDARNRARSPGRGTALGCAGRTGARARVLTLGVRRVDPVAEFEPAATGASRHGAQRLSPARNRAGRSPTPHKRARTTTASPGQKSPRSSSS
jgi:hypothetical protein